MKTMPFDVNANIQADLNGRRLKNLLIVFFPVFIISLLVTAVLYYQSYLDGNGGNIPAIIGMLLIMVALLLIPPILVYFRKSKVTTWLMISILLVLFGLWEIGFDAFALLIFPIILDLFILLYGTERSLKSHI